MTITTAAPQGAASPTPERSTEFAHLDLEGLRQYRSDLEVEEHRVSYWRRLVQARLDLLRTNGNGASFDRLQCAFAEDRPARGRTALMAVVPQDDMPPLPELDELWHRPMNSNDPAVINDLAQELSFAEFQLSTYRTALHRRLDRATNELIARYRENPYECLVALPLNPR
ncbi:MAG TPA: hypothetical protein DHW34_03080 [Actinobacteria bacterium]|nr:hypothetical protein [Actinomycetota bacterium]HCK78982.1 hypothetical protein [Actinomycetota bacterium]